MASIVSRHFSYCIAPQTAATSDILAGALKLGATVMSHFAIFDGKSSQTVRDCTVAETR